MFENISACDIDFGLVCDKYLADTSIDNILKLLLRCKGELHKIFFPYYTTVNTSKHYLSYSSQ